MAEMSNITKIEAGCYDEVVRLRKHAQEIVDHFWCEREKMIDSKLLYRMPLIGCRIKDEGASFGIVWFYYDFYTMKGTNKKRRTNAHIPKPRSQFKYSIRTLFKYTLPQEKELVLYCENHFGLIRTKLNYLRRLRQWITHYKKIE